MVLIAAVVLLLTYYKAVAHFDGLAHDKFVLAKAQLETDVKTAKTQAVQTNTDQIDLQNKLNIEIAARQNRDQQIAKLLSDLQTQRQKDNSLTPSDLSLRWSGLIGVQPLEIKPNPDGLVVSIPASHETVSQLEEIPVLRETNKQDQTLLIHQNDLMGGFQKVITDLQNEKSTCKKELSDKDIEYKAEIAKVKADSRKHGFWYALGGFVGGVLLSKRF
jgi:hypothetical protein